MPVVLHLHQWTHVTGGLLCTVAPCTAFMTHAVLQANNSSSAGGGNQGNRHDGQNDFNNAWKKSGGG